MREIYKFLEFSCVIATILSLGLTTNASAYADLSDECHCHSSEPTGEDTNSDCNQISEVPHEERDDSCDCDDDCNSCAHVTSYTPLWNGANKFEVPKMQRRIMIAPVNHYKFDFNSRLLDPPRA